jgi:hypothetical protein
MLDYTIELINDQARLERLVQRLASTPVIALDIETINWWNRHQERVALIQLAFQTERQPKVAIIDALAKLNLDILRLPLELNTTIKVIHNAVFDATRLANHFQFSVAPIYDTMVAARRSGERRYSLQAQAELYLGLHIDKGCQGSDWGRRPLATKQIHYAALDAFSTLLLYENQIKRKLNGTFQSKSKILSQQATLPLTDLSTDLPESNVSPASPIECAQIEEKVPLLETILNASSLALLGIITELPSRYHPDQLTVSVGSDRVGLAGWIIDRTLDSDTGLDEETAKAGIADLHDQELIKVTPTRRLEATGKGANLWRQLKST